MGKNKPRRARKTASKKRPSRTPPHPSTRRSQDQLAAPVIPITDSFDNGLLSDDQVAELGERLVLLLKHGRELVLQTHAPNSCIISTRVAVDFLREGGFVARPAVAEARLYNAAMATRVLDRRWPQSRAEGDQWAAEGCQCVFLGAADTPPQPGGWPGHLVCIVEESFLVDLSLDQADRPAKGIRAEPHAVPVSPYLLSGAGEGLYGSADGGLVTYRLRPGDETFRASPDWRLIERREPALMALRLLLGEHPSEQS